MQRGLLLVICLFTGELLAQPAPKSQEPLTLFKISGSNVSSEEFIYHYKKNHPKKEDYTEAKVNEYLDLLITFKAKVIEATNRGYDTTTAFQKEYDSYRAELRKPYTAGTDQLDRLTREAYERMTLEIRASHILISVKPDAPPGDTLSAYNKTIALRERLLKGEAIDRLAREFSSDPGGKANGGDLGYFSVLQMVYPFETAVYSLKTGEISMPVRTNHGYHVIKVIDRRIARGEVEVSHIILRTGTGDEKKVKAKIFELYDQLQGGRPWDEVCSEFSDDQGTRNSGGRLRPFGTGALSGIPEFETAAFSLHEPGEISDPFKSSYGWHIVRLEKRIPTPPYEEVAASLKRRVSRDSRLQMADHKVQSEKKKAFQFVEQTDTKTSVFLLADSLQKATWKFSGDQTLLAKPLFSLRGKNYPVSQFVTYVRREHVLNKQAPASPLGSQYEKFVQAKIGELEEQDVFASNPEYRSLILEYKEGILLFTIMEKEVWNKASEDTVGLRKYYHENLEKYRAGERVSARVFATEDSVFHSAMMKKVRAGDSISRQDMRKFKAVQGPRRFATGESKAIDKVSKTIGVHTTRVEGTFYMIQIDNLVPAGIRTLEEVRSQVISDYQDHLEKKWVAALLEKHPVKVNSKGKKFVIRELTKS